MAVAQFNSKENKGNILNLPVLNKFSERETTDSRLHQLKLKLEQK